MAISEEISNGEIKVVSSQEKIYETHLSYDEALARQLQAFENILIGTSETEFHEIHSMEFPNMEPVEERSLDVEPNLVPVQESLPDLESRPVPQEAIRQDNINPDNLSYEELQSLGEAVGKENKGLSEDLISYLPTSKYRTGFFSRKSTEECVVCKTYYKSGERLIMLPCQHKYHADCITQWLQINKVCPVCNEEVFG